MSKINESGYGYSRAELINAIKDLGYHYKFDKYTDQQLYNILNKSEQRKLKDEEEKLNAAKETAKFYDKNKKLEKYKWYNNYKGYDIYINSENNLFKVEGNDIEFPDEVEAMDYIDNNLEYDDNVSEYFEEYLPEEKRKKKAMGWFTRFNRDPEKSQEMFNKNTTYNDQFSGASSEGASGGEAAGGSAGGGE